MFKRIIKEVLVFALKTLSKINEKRKQKLRCISYQEVADLEYIIMSLIAEKNSPIITENHVNL